MDNSKSRPTLPNHQLDALLVAETKRSFGRGNYNNAVSDAIRLVEDTVRSKCSFARRHTGVALMSMAFHPEDGLLVDPAEPRSEQEGLQYLAMGLFSRFRSISMPASQNMLLEDALDALHLASYLLRLIEKRNLNAPPLTEL
jgi:uncharacterized protein (TIGR02391 family)